MKEPQLEVATQGRGIYRLDGKINRWLRTTGTRGGLCHLFILHTSASLIVTENADPDVHRDLEVWMSANVIDGDPRFAHDCEGPDDMPAHIRSVLTQTAISVPVDHQGLVLGTWQGVYLWEHRVDPHHRRVRLTLLEN